MELVVQEKQAMLDEQSIQLQHMQLDLAQQSDVIRDTQAWHNNISKYIHTSADKEQAEGDCGGH